MWLIMIIERVEVEVEVEVEIEISRVEKVIAVTCTSPEDNELSGLLRRDHLMYFL
jgi:hypothetical protein